MDYDERWGEDHDKNKHPHDWAATLVYLLGKAMQSSWDGDAERVKHHIITIAAACGNWHKQVITLERKASTGVVG